MIEYPKPNAQDIAGMNAIIARVTLTPKGVPVYAPGDYVTGGHYSKRFTGWRPNGPCTSCQRVLFDKLRTLVGMTYARNPLDHGRMATRKEICHACPAYNPHTDSCGRLILDALDPQPVTIDGEKVLPCGCIISLKAMFKSETCPGKYWPK